MSSLSSALIRQYKQSYVVYLLNKSSEFFIFDIKSKLFQVESLVVREAMHSYSSYYNIRDPNHHTLQDCNKIPGCTKFYNKLGDCCMWVKQRYLICVLTALGLTIGYMQRMCLSIMMTEMTSVKKQRKEGSYCEAFSNQSATAGQSSEDKFDWNLSLQGMILAAFFYGYFITHIPGGIISDLFGAKHIFGVTILLSSACSALSPIAANWGPYYLFGIRFIMGLIQGPIFPVITTLVAHWAPPEERGIMNTICNTGVPMGLVLGNLLTGALLGVLKDWTYPFYIYAIVGAFWFLIWLVIASPSPMSHPYISNKEADFIQMAIMAESKPVTGSIPWWPMMKDKHFLVATLANFGHEAGLFFIATELPIYWFNVIQLTISMNGIMSAVPWMSMWVGNILFGELSHVLAKKNILSRIAIRRIFGAICNIFPGVFWVLVVFVGCDYILVAVVISCGTFFVGAVFCSVRSSFLDISPNFAGISMSIAAGVAGTSGFIVPLFVHSLIGEGTKVEDWTWSFLIICGFVIISTIPYLLVIRAEVQPWDAGRSRKP